MFKALSKYADAPARALMSGIFILSGLGKLGALAATQGYMQAYGIPPELLAPTIAFEIGSGLLLLVGLGTRVVAALLAGFSLVTGAIFHRDFSDQIQMIMLLKNVSMAGGFLAIAAHGAPGLSLDRLIARRKHP
jgi:putative oxidoreductase